MPVDDRQLVQHVFIMMCRQCFHRIDPKVEKAIGRCPKCNSHFSAPRMMTKKEQKQFLRNKLAGQFVVNNRRFITGDGIEAIPTEQLDELRDIVSTSIKIDDEEVRLRKDSQKRGLLRRPIKIPFFGRRKT